jgi:hypothetical protein
MWLHCSTKLSLILSLYYDTTYQHDSELESDSPRCFDKTLLDVDNSGIPVTAMVTVTDPTNGNCVVTSSRQVQSSTSHTGTRHRTFSNSVSFSLVAYYYRRAAVVTVEIPSDSERSC